VTGAGAGLGRAYALQLAARGARVVVNGRSEANIRETVEEIQSAGGEALSCVVDVSGEDAGGRIVEAAMDRWGRIDALVNNAGVGHMGDAENVRSEDFETDLGVSVVGSLALAVAAWPHLRASGSGRIVNTSSSSIFGIPSSIPYATAKAAVLGLTHALAQDGEGVGIKVNAVMPLAATAMNANLSDEELVKFFRDHFPVDQAAAIVLLLCHERAPCTGELFATGGGFTGRIALVLGRGVVDTHPTPEALLERFAEVESLAGGIAPESSHATRQFIVERLQGKSG